MSIISGTPSAPTRLPPSAAMRIGPALPASQGITVDLHWLVHLRFVAAAGQCLTLAAVWLMGAADVEIGAMLAVEGVLLASNMLLWWLVRPGRVSGGNGLEKHPFAVAAGVLTADTVFLTALLALSGGPMNPYTIFYLVHVVMASVLLSARWTWGIVALCGALYSALFLLTPVTPHHLHSADFAVHLYGMLTSFVIAAGCSAYFVLLVQRERRGVHVRLLQSQASAAQLERFAALTAMAAGAAHELATPLGTIAVAARELERAASRVASGSTLAEDARLIREEVDRCRSILDQMMPPAPSPDGCEPLTPVMVAHDLPTWIPAAHRPQVRVTVTESAGSLLLPRSRTLQAIAALISNALDALRAPPGASLRSDAREAPGIPEVRVHLGVDQSALTVRVEDRGQGMTPEVQARLGEPFFTTKPPGQGRGLGLFLVRQLVQQVEGRLTVQSVPGHGTTIVLRLPSLEPAGAPVDGERGALREGSL